MGQAAAAMILTLALMWSLGAAASAPAEREV